MHIATIQCQFDGHITKWKVGHCNMEKKLPRSVSTNTFHLDNKLSWNVHVHSVCSKVHQRWSWQLDHAYET